MKAKPRPAVAVLLLLGAALAGWTIVDHLAVRVPDAPRLVSDGAYYADIARSIARGDGYQDRIVRPVQLDESSGGPPVPSGIFGPFYPALTALAFRLTGSVETITSRPAVPVAVNLLGHLVAVVALYGLARRILPRLAWLPPLCLALDPRALVLTTDGLTEGWSAAWLVLTAWALVVPRRRLPLAGLAFAGAVLTRASNAAFLPVYLAVLWSRAPDRRPRAMAAFAVPAVIVVGAWMLVREASAGAPLVEIQRYNLLHDLGPFEGSIAFHTLDAADPLAYALSHPLALAAKVATGLVKCLALLPTRFWNVFVLAAASFGLATIWARARRGEAPLASVALLLAGPALVQLLVMAATLLDPRLFVPPSAPLYLAAGAGVAELAARAPASRRGSAVGLGVALLVAVPFGRLAGDLATSGREAALARRGASASAGERAAVAALVTTHVPPGEVLITDLDTVGWEADRPVVERPADPTELPRLQALSSSSYILWEPAGPPGRMGAETAARWARVLAGMEARGTLRRVAEVETAGRRVVLSARAGHF